MKGLTLTLTPLVLLAAAPASQAGIYTVQSCGTSTGGEAFVSTNQSPATLRVTSECPPNEGAPFTGLTASTVPEGGATPSGATASWTLKAPEGTVIRRLAVERQLGRRNDAWAAEVVAAGRAAPLDSCSIQEGESSCTTGPTTAAIYDRLDTGEVSFRVRCVASPSCANPAGPSRAWVTVYGATAYVEDPNPPVVSPLGGSILGSGWHRGSGRVNVSASDAGGVGALELSAAGVSLGRVGQPCDYTRMQPCPANAHAAFDVDTSKLPDGTFDLVATATDAANQQGVAHAVLRVDRTPPTAPTGLAVERNPDATYALSWANPEQGTASPVGGAWLQVCTAGVCGSPVRYAGRDIRQLPYVALAAGEKTIKVWLEDEAGNADAANAAAVTLDPAVLEAPRTVDVLPPLLDGGPAPSPRLKLTTARRSGATLTLSGTIAKGASATITGAVSAGRTTRALASARTRPRRGKWSLRIRLTGTLRRSEAFYVKVAFAGQKAFAKTSLKRRLSRKPPKRGRASDEFSLEARST